MKASLANVMVMGMRATRAQPQPHPADNVRT